MTREEILEQWPEFEKHPDYVPWNCLDGIPPSIHISESEYTAARSALLRVAELEEKNRKLVELLKRTIGNTRFLEDFHNAGVYQRELEQLTKE